MEVNKEELLEYIREEVGHALDISMLEVFEITDDDLNNVENAMIKARDAAILEIMDKRVNKYRVGFTYEENGFAVIEALSEEEAKDKMREALDYSGTDDLVELDVVGRDFRATDANEIKKTKQTGDDLDE